MTSYPALRELAEKATQLEWEVGDRWVFVPPEDAANNPHHALRNVFKDVSEAQANCEYVVAAQPLNIIPILDNYDAALAEIDRLKEALPQHSERLKAGLEAAVKSIKSRPPELRGSFKPESPNDA